MKVEALVTIPDKQNYPELKVKRGRNSVLKRVVADPNILFSVLQRRQNRWLKCVKN